MSFEGVILFIGIVAAIAATLITFEPKIDRNSETGDYILWYNTRDGREHLILWKSSFIL